MELDDRPLLSGLGFCLRAGDLVQVCGANGSGKTTLMRALAGLVPLADGEVLWRGRRVQRQWGRFRAELLFIGHRLGLKTGLTAEENLRLVAGVKAPVVARDWRQCLLAVGLGSAARMPVWQLSAGQQRRVALAQLAVSPATLWLLDEPFTALDPQAVAWVEAQLQRHLLAGGVAVVTSHQPLSAHLGARQLELNVQDVD